MAGRLFLSPDSFGENPADELTFSVPSIDSTHHNLHEGIVFRAHDNVTTGTARVFLIVTGANVAHLLVEVISDSKVKTSLLSGPTVSANGTVVPSFNASLTKSNVPTTAIYQTPTVSANGTEIDMLMAGSAHNAGGQDRGLYEWDLSPNSKYLVSASFASNSDVIHRFTWYETGVDL